MIELTYIDSYQVERKVSYPNPDAFLLAFAGCVTVPDNLKVVSVTYNGKVLPYQGIIGDLYRWASQFDFASAE